MNESRAIGVRSNLTSVLQLFDWQRHLNPGAIAVSFSGRHVTYAQLDDRANQIGSCLRGAGVERESLVALYLERSPELIAALLGVWKAGGAYLPIDPSNPRQRVAFTLEDSRVKFILTERALLESIPETDARILCIEDVCPLDRETPSFVTTNPSPDQLAYVIYTSGSTGKPKGAEVCHGGLLNVVQVIGRDLDLKPKDVAVASATIAFDISNLEIYVPLTAGATIHMMESHFTGDGLKLIETIHANRAVLVFGTPTSWRLMLEAGWQGSPDLQIITGGEVLPLSLAKTLTRMTRALWNHYGPTETSICATRERVSPDAEIITLGLPINNVKIHILDDDLNPVELGATGELYIGGVGVGRGYLNRPELTARTFLPDPFDSKPGARIYKTGDLGRLLADGRLDFQGRADNQIKLRGFRIELEEIESAIRDFEGVHAASVQLVEYGAADLRLVAYFLGETGITSNQLRDFLRQRLPFYMLPSELIPLESLPMTINGKIDRAALDQIRIKFEARAQAESVQPPADDFEAKLRVIWQKLLKVRNIGPSDDFFDLGGHSLLATRMFAEIEKLTGRTIPLSVLVQNPTVHQLAAYIHDLPQKGWPGLVPIRAEGSLPPLFISHGLGSNLLLFRALTESLGENQPVYGIQLTAPVNASLDELRLEAFAERYVDEICAVDPAGPYYLAGHSLGGLLVFEIATQLRRRGKQIGLLALLDCKFHLAQRSENLPPSDPVNFDERVRNWKKKLSRLSESGIVNTVWRKFLYNQLMFKIWALRQLHREGTYYPNVFGLDPYIALFAENYHPQPIEGDAVLFAAEDELSPESLGKGWEPVIQGVLELQKIPGSHQTILTHPNVAVLAQELTKRLDSKGGTVGKKPIPLRRDRPERGMNSLLEYHGG
jgi:amino acid adenylation domain-containing protein